MIVQTGKLNWFHKSTHGYFLAKNLFRGIFRREVFLTVYDSKINKSCYGYLFLCDDSVFLSIIGNLSNDSGIYKLESSDFLKIIDDEIKLKQIINATNSGERYANVSSANEICYLSLNNKYLLLINIQSDSVYYPTIASGAYSVKYLNHGDYIIKVKNLVSVISNILNKQAIASYPPIHGISAIVSNLIIYSQVFVMFTIVTAFLFYITGIFNIN